MSRYNPSVYLDLQERGINVLDLGVKLQTNAGSILNNIISVNDGKTLWFPAGVYYIDQTVTIANQCNLNLDAGAELRAVASMTDMIQYNNASTPTMKRFIRGGVFNGNGQATNTVHVIACANLKISDAIVKDGLSNNILYDSTGLGSGTSYELHLNSLFIDNSQAYSVNPNLIGINLQSGDGYIEDIVIKNCTTGVSNAALNQFTKIHVWGNDINRLPNTIGFTTSNVVLADQLYLDTCWIGFQQTNSSPCYLTNCNFYTAPSYDTQLSQQVKYIDNATALVCAIHCQFGYYTSEKTVILSTTDAHLRLQDCVFSSPFTTSSTYLVDTALNNTMYRLNVNSVTVAAGATVQATFSIANIPYNALYHFQPYGNNQPTLITTCYLQPGKVCIEFYNPTASSITVSNAYAIIFYQMGSQQLPVTNTLNYP